MNACVRFKPHQMREAGILPKSREMSKRKLSHMKPRAPHLIHRFSTEEDFSSIEPWANDRQDNRAHFVRSRASRCHPGGDRFRASSSLRSKATEDAGSPARPNLRRRVSQANTRGEALRPLRHPLRGLPGSIEKKNDKSHRRSPARSSKPDADDLRADCRAHFFQLNKRPVRDPVSEFSTGREIRALWKSTARNRRRASIVGLR
jgi:hypothetical protein